MQPPRSQRIQACSRHGKFTYTLPGNVLNLGADWRLTDAHGSIRPDARYVIQTDDGTHVLVQTEGPTPPNAGGHSILRAKFETGANGTYAWLNDVVAVGILTRKGTEKVLIDMWNVSNESVTSVMMS
jgi:hypothetical protein